MTGSGLVSIGLTDGQVVHVAPVLDERTEHTTAVHRVTVRTETTLCGMPTTGLKTAAFFGHLEMAALPLCEGCRHAGG